jgi:hypothetical protein
VAVRAKAAMPLKATMRDLDALMVAFRGFTAPKAPDTTTHRRLADLCSLLRIP